MSDPTVERLCRDVASPASMFPVRFVYTEFRLCAFLSVEQSAVVLGGGANGASTTSGVVAADGQCLSLLPLSRIFFLEDSNSDGRMVDMCDENLMCLVAVILRSNC